MLVMHYRIKLGGGRLEAAAAIRRRVAERGSRFDGMSGLERKFFLLDPADPTYAALAFLQGPLFAAVIESFGRPAVRLLLSTAIELPSTLPRSVSLIDDAQEASSGPRIEAVDPLDGRKLVLDFAEAGRGRRFELLYTTRDDQGKLPR